MKVEIMSAASLEFVAKDCIEAIKAMPENPKNREYLKSANECLHELRLRAECIGKEK